MNKNRVVCDIYFACIGSGRGVQPSGILREIVVRSNPWYPQGLQSGKLSGIHWVDGDNSFISQFQSMVLQPATASMTSFSRVQFCSMIWELFLDAEPQACFSGTPNDSLKCLISLNKFLFYLNQPEQILVFATNTPGHIFLSHFQYPGK